MKIKLVIELESTKTKEFTHFNLNKFLREKQEELNRMGYNAHTISYIFVGKSHGE